MAANTPRSESSSKPQQPTIEEQIRYYDDWNLACRAGGFEEVDIKVRARADYVLLWVSELGRTDLQILEVGCGTGWLTERLTDYGDVTAIDLSPAAIAFAKSRTSDAEFVADDFMNRKFRMQHFDIVICVETLFYVTDQDAFLEKSYGLLKSDGWFAATTINKFIYERNSAIGAAKKGQVRHWLSKRELRKIISKAFDICAFKTIFPEGDTGILRLMNSHKINKILNYCFGVDSVTRLKERAGLGGGIIIIAQKKKELARTS